MAELTGISENFVCHADVHVVSNETGIYLKYESLIVFRLIGTSQFDDQEK